ncbi:hypothetical protein M407DRAFT_12567, partial [Tulasnella calospora MUT 4182]
MPHSTTVSIDEYQDFKISNNYNSSCQLPTMWLENGTLYDVGFAGWAPSSISTETWRLSVSTPILSKFASVQDRLREWQPDVMAKIQKFSCKALDFDGTRIDKATQVTLEALSKWTTHTHECAAAVGKTNFFIPAEVTGGNAFGSLYYGPGRMPTQLPPGFLEASQITPKNSQYFLRDVSQIALDAMAFHYSIYRSLSRFLGMDGNLQVAYDVGVNFVSAWNQIFIDNDMINYNTGLVDPKHMFGLANFDIFRWSSLVNGTQKQMLGTFITSLVMPGIPLSYYDEEQGFYLFGRQPMTSNTAWQRHGCYKFGSEQYFNMPLERSVLGCKDDWNSLDHFEPTSAPYRQMAHFMYIRKHFPSLQDGFNLVQRYNNSYFIELPGSNGVATEIGFWSVTRSFLDSQVKAENDWIISPYPEGTVVRNLFYPFDTITLSHTLDPFNGDGKAPYTGCIPSITFDPYGFKAYVPVADWLDPPPALTKFSPGHDAQHEDRGGEFRPRWNAYDPHGSMNCQALTGQPLSYLSGDTFSTWRWSGTLDNVPDGITRLTLTNVPWKHHSHHRTDGPPDVPDYDSTAFTYASNQFTFTHKAFGAEMFRYSWNFGENWTDWTAIEAVTTIPETTFDHDDTMFWEDWSSFSASAYTVVHADYGYSTPRRVPKLLARGPYNQWGFDKGLTNQFDHREDGKWELESMANWPSYIQINVFANDDYFYGDTGGDGVMEHLPPNSVAPNYLNMSAPPWPYLSWTLVVDDTTLTWSLKPRGQSWIGAAMYAMLLAIPMFTAILACLIFKWSFYGIKINQYGMQPKESYFPIFGAVGAVFGAKEKGDGTPMTEKFADSKPYTGQMVGWPEVTDKRRKVLITTLEYEIIDWKLKVKIGGLGVTSSLM